MNIFLITLGVAALAYGALSLNTNYQEWKKFLEEDETDYRDKHVG